MAKYRILYNAVVSGTWSDSRLYPDEFDTAEEAFEAIYADGGHRGFKVVEIVYKDVEPPIPPVPADVQAIVNALNACGRVHEVLIKVSNYDEPHSVTAWQVYWHAGRFSWVAEACSV